MVRLNVSILIPDSSRAAELIDLATELVEFSLRDKGVIDYDLYRSTTNDDRLLIVETWTDVKALEKHQESEHYRRIAPQLRDLGTLTVERFDF